MNQALRPSAGLGETELNRLFYRLGWTKGWYKGDPRKRTFDEIADETMRDFHKARLTELFYRSIINRMIIYLNLLFRSSFRE